MVEENHLHIENFMQETGSLGTAKGPQRIWGIAPLV